MSLRSTKYSSHAETAATAVFASSSVDNNVRILPYPAVIPYRIELQDPDDEGRKKLESFVQGTFKRAYDANVQHFLPRLMSLTNSQNELIAAVGFHAAQDESLFLEQYLDKPVEDAIREKLGCNVQRRKIMEVGNLAIATAGGARGLILALTSYIKGAGFDWVVFTAVPSLINSFNKMGLEITPLVEAKKERLITDKNQWGSYYDVKPMVVAGNVKQGFEKLGQLLTLEHSLNVMQTLWSHAYTAGYQRRKGYELFSSINM